MTNPISEERLRNTLAWATARLGQLSGAEVIVGAITELLERRVEVEKYKAWAAACDELSSTAYFSKSLDQPMADEITSVEPREDAEFLSLVGHCSNCSCQDCREFFKADARARVEPAAPQKCWLCGEDGSRPCQYGYDTDKGCIRVKRCALKQPADRKSALDEIVRISEEAGLYNEPSGDGLARQCDKLTEQLARAQKAITSAMDALSNGRTDDGARILRECFWLGDKR